MVKCAIENCDEIGKYRFKQLQKLTIVDLPLRNVRTQKLCEVINVSLFLFNEIQQSTYTRNTTTTFSETKLKMNGTVICMKMAWSTKMLNFSTVSKRWWFTVFVNFIKFFFCEFNSIKPGILEVWYTDLPFFAKDTHYKIYCFPLKRRWSREVKQEEFWW